MALLSPYTDLAYANTINVGKLEWENASDSQKNNALVQARYFIDSKYTCVAVDDMDVDDLTTVPDEFQVANSLLAYEYILGTLFEYDALGGQAVVAKRVKADKVEVETNYSGFMSGPVKKGDKYPEVTALLSVYCTRGSHGQLVRV